MHLVVRRHACERRLGDDTPRSFTVHRHTIPSPKVNSAQGPVLENPHTAERARGRATPQPSNIAAEQHRSDPAQQLRRALRPTGTARAQALPPRAQRAATARAPPRPRASPRSPRCTGPCRCGRARPRGQRPVRAHARRAGVALQHLLAAATARGRSVRAPPAAGRVQAPDFGNRVAIEHRGAQRVFPVATPVAHPERNAQLHAVAGRGVVCTAQPVEVGRGILPSPLPCQAVLAVLCLLKGEVLLLSNAGVRAGQDRTAKRIEAHWCLGSHSTSEVTFVGSTDTSFPLFVRHLRAEAPVRHARAAASTNALAIGTSNLSSSQYRFSLRTWASRVSFPMSNPRKWRPAQRHTLRPLPRSAKIPRSQPSILVHMRSLAPRFGVISPQNTYTFAERTEPVSYLAQEQLAFFLSQHPPCHVDLTIPS